MGLINLHVQISKTTASLQDTNHDLLYVRDVLTYVLYLNCSINGTLYQKTLYTRVCVCVCVHVFYNKDDSDFKVNISEEKREFLEF